MISDFSFAQFAGRKNNQWLYDSIVVDSQLLTETASSRV
jgi:hypothetical protein